MKKAIRKSEWLFWRSGWDSNPRGIAPKLISRGIANKVLLYKFAFCSILSLKHAPLIKKITFLHTGAVFHFISAVLTSGTIWAP